MDILRLKPQAQAEVSRLIAAFNGQVLGTFGKYGVLSFNGNKMITTSGGGALICNHTIANEVRNEEGGMWNDAENTPNSSLNTPHYSETAEQAAQNIMWYATQARDAYPYYQHTAIGYNYRMSNVCAGIGRGQMTVLDAHIAHHKHVQALYEQLLAEVPGITIHKQPDVDVDANVDCNDDDNANVNCGCAKEKSASTLRSTSKKYDSNFWLCTMTIDPDVKVVGQENAYKEIIKTAVGGAAGVIHAVDSATTDCQPNDNVEAMRVFMLSKKVECRPVWKPMHKQPVYGNGDVDANVDILEGGIKRITTSKSVTYTNGVEEDIFKIGMCLPAGPYVSDDDVRYIVDCIKEAIVK